MSRVWRYTGVGRRHLQICRLGLENVGDVGKSGGETLRSCPLYVACLVQVRGRTLERNVEDLKGKI